MDPRARDWYDRRTTAAAEWSVDRVLALKGGHRISVVIPARNEEATVADVVGLVRRDLVEQVPLVDELVVMDSRSTDLTAARAHEAGAQVWSVADVVPELGVREGKGEALWKSLFVTTGDLLVFVDADLTEWGTHFVMALVGPLLAEPGLQLSKGFYDRLMDDAGSISAEGGRVTELVARPLIGLHWPALSGVVQPLAGEWAIRRRCAERLPFPVGYGVELATLLDVARDHGLDAVVQVDLGRRAHVHQNLHDLGAMAAEILAVASRRLDIGVASGPVVLPRLDREAGWEERPVPTEERPPAVSVTQYAERAAVRDQG